MKEYKIGIDIKRELTRPIEGINAGDSVLFCVTLTDGGEIYDFSGVNIIKLSAKLGDDSMYTVETPECFRMVEPARGYLEFVVPQVFLQDEGMHQLQIALFEGENKISTAKVNYFVDEELSGGTVEADEGTLSTYDNLMKNVSEKVIAAENERAAAEKEREAEIEKLRAIILSRVGYNIFDGKLEQGYWDTDTQTFRKLQPKESTPSNSYLWNWVCSANSLPCVSGEQIDFIGSWVFNRFGLIFWDDENDYIGYEAADNSSSLSVVVPEGATKFTFHIRGKDNSQHTTPEEVGEIFIYYNYHNSIIYEIRNELSPLSEKEKSDILSRVGYNIFDGKLEQGYWDTDTQTFRKLQPKESTPSNDARWYWVCSANSFICKSDDRIDINGSWAYNRFGLIFWDDENAYVGYEAADNSSSLSVVVPEGATKFTFHIRGKANSQHTTPEEVGEIFIYYNHHNSIICEIRNELSPLIDNNYDAIRTHIDHHYMSGLTNIFDGELEQGYWDTDTQTFRKLQPKESTPSNDARWYWVCSANSFICKSGDRIDINGSWAYNRFGLIFWDDENDYIGYEATDNSSSLSVVVPEGATKFTFHIRGKDNFQHTTPEEVGEIFIYYNSIIYKICNELLKLHTETELGRNETTNNEAESNMVEKLLQLNRHKYGKTNTPLTLIHFSDIHNNTTNISRILEFYEKHNSYVDDVIHSGDSVNKYFTDSNPFETVGGDTVLNVIGNHECWIQGDTWDPNNPDYYPYNATAEQAYQKFIAPFISNWGVTQAGENLCYYYKEYPNHKIRVIFIDSSHFDSAQEAWLSSTLNGAKENGFSVICVSHYPSSSGIAPIDCSFASLDQTTGPKRYQVERTPESANIIVEGFISSGGDFICWLCGHLHYDNFGVVADFPNQLTIAVSTARTDNIYGDEARVVGTNTQDCFNVVSFDPATKVVKLVRVGAKYDRLLRKKETLCVNYHTKQIISNN